MINTIELPNLTADDLLAPRFGSADICAAVGCNTQWLKNMLSRTPPMVPLQPDERAAVGDRQYFALSLRTVIHLALVRRLAQAFPIQQAAYLAEAFTRVGSPLGNGFWAEEMLGLLERGDLYLVAHHGEPGPAATFVEEAQCKTVAEFLAEAHVDGSWPVVVINLSALVRDACEALDLYERAGELVAD